MPTTTVHYVSERQFVGTDSRGQAVLISGDSNAGGVSPSQMLLIALSSCTAVDISDIMKKKRKPLTMLEVVATGEQDPDPPWAYRKIHLRYRVAGKGVTEKALSRAIDLSQEKYCSVAATVRGVATITTSYEIISDVK